MNIGIIGVGTVGEALIKNIEKNKELIKARCGKEIEVKEDELYFSKYPFLRDLIWWRN